MSPAENEKLDEALALLREQSERMGALEARLSNLEIDQKLLREAFQAQGQQMGLLLERSVPLLTEEVVEDPPELSLDGEPTHP